MAFLRVRVRVRLKKELKNNSYADSFGLTTSYIISDKITAPNYPVAELL